VVELRELEYFVAVVEERNFTRAAKRLHVVQSAVSAGVSRLEREFGTTLFDRSGRTVALTEAGQIFLKRVRALLGEARGVREDMSRLAGGLEGTVTIGRVLSTGSFGLTAALTAFQRTHPAVAVHLRLIAGPPPEHIAALRDGHLDLALLPVLAPAPAGVVSEQIATMQMALAAHADDPLARNRGVAYHEVASRRFIDFPEHWGNRLIIDRLFHDAGVERAVTIEVVDVASALEMVQARLGLAFVPEEALAECHDLVRVDLRQPPPRIGLGLTSLDDRPMSAATRALRDALLEQSRH
jgi:DNA-binding transcriptional LysR family regulator